MTRRSDPTGRPAALRGAALRARRTALACVLACLPAAWGDVPASGEIDIVAGPGVGPLSDAVLAAGRGQVERISWLGPIAPERTCVGYFRLASFGWEEVGIRFTPRRGGLALVTLRAVWHDAADPRAVLWDAGVGEGAELRNGGFEATTGPFAKGWVATDDARVTDAPAGAAAAEGVRCGVTTPTNTLSQVLRVRAGEAVTVRFLARAMPRRGSAPARVSLPAANTPAHRAAARLRRGVNMGAGFEVPPGEDWGVRHAARDIAHIRGEGLDHIRVPVAWHRHVGATGAIDPALFAAVDGVVGPALEAGLSVVLTLHHFDAFMREPVASLPLFLDIWEQVAAHYAARPDGLMLELLNEPRDGAGGAALNAAYAEGIARVRRIDPGRTILVSPGGAASADRLEELDLPASDSNLVVTVHCYEPFLFTHQGASWTQPLTATTGILYPGPPRRPVGPDARAPAEDWIARWFEGYSRQPMEFNPCGPVAFRYLLRHARRWAEHAGRPVRLGEFGCHAQIDRSARARYCTAMREEAESLGMGWTLWDWKAAFAYWDDRAGRPLAGMRGALFGAGRGGQP